MRPVHVLATAALAAALLAGCGSSPNAGSTTTGGAAAGGSQAPPAARTPTAPAGATARSCGNTTVAGTEQLRVAGVGCAIGRGVVAAWVNKRACLGPAGASRPACSVSDYRCLGVRTSRGTAVSCAQPGRSISFVAKRG